MAHSGIPSHPQNPKKSNPSDREQAKVMMARTDNHKCYLLPVKQSSTNVTFVDVEWKGVQDRVKESIFDLLRKKAMPTMTYL